VYPSTHVSHVSQHTCIYMYTCITCIPAHMYHMYLCITCIYIYHMYPSTYVSHVSTCTLYTCITCIPAHMYHMYASTYVSHVSQHSFIYMYICITCIYMYTCITCIYIWYMYHMYLHVDTCITCIYMYKCSYRSLTASIVHLLSVVARLRHDTAPTVWSYIFIQRQLKKINGILNSRNR